MTGTIREALTELERERLASLLPAAHDAVNHPSHYTSDPSGVECIQITRHRDYLIGASMKYLWRAGLKSDPDKSAAEKEIEDLEKARWYIAEKIKMLKEGM